MTFTRETLVSKVTKWTKSLQENVEIAIEELFAKHAELAAKEKALEENVAAKGEGGGTGGEIALAPALSGHVYVRPGGNNASSGGSWSSAKADIPSALAALPLVGLERYGVVHLSSGTHTVSSTLVRTENLKFEGKTQYVEAPGARPTDIGSVLIAPKLKGAPSTEMTLIEDAWEGELSAAKPPAPVNKKAIPASGAPTGTNKRWFTVQGEPGKTGASPSPMWVIIPAIKLPNGVTLDGAGATAGAKAYKSGAATTIKDVGTGITVYMSPAEAISPKAPGMRSAIRNLTLDGSGTAIDGYDVINTFMTTWENFMVKGYLRWGINSGANGMSNASWINGDVQECGQVFGEVGGQIEIEGGGMRVFAGAPVGTMINVNCRNNFGTNCIGAGIHAIGCLFNGAFPQEIKGSSPRKFLAQSGVGYWDESTITPSNITGAWMEGNAFVNVVASGTHLIGCHFQAKHGPGDTGLEPLHTHYAVEAGQGGVTMDNCYFIRNFSVALVKEANTESTISWRNCQISGSPTEEAQATPWNKKVLYAEGAIVESPPKIGTNWIATQENFEQEPKAESPYWDPYTNTNTFIERNKAPNILAPAALGRGTIVGVTAEFQQGQVTGPMNAVKESLNPQRLVIGTSTNPNILRLITKGQEGLKVAIVESGSTSKIVISNGGGTLQESALKANASELLAWYGELEGEGKTKKFKNLAFRELVNMVEGTEYNIGKTSRIELKAATALTSALSATYINPFDRDLRITQAISFGSEEGTITFARGAALGGQAILTEKFSSSMAINTSLVPLTGALAKGYTVGSLVVFTKFNSGVAGLDLATPYWVYASSESGIEVSKIPFGEAGAAAITVRNQAPQASSEVALLMTWKRTDIGEGIIQDLYLPARYSLSLALTKGASLNGQAILTPA